MVISETTVKLLQNFAGISSSLLLVPGTKQRTMAPGKSVLGVVEFPEPWPQETGIYDLNAFLGTLSLFSKPEVKFEESAFVISSGKSRVRYNYSDPSTILTPPNKVLPSANPAVEFGLIGALQQLNKTCSILKLPTVTIDINTARHDEESTVIVSAADLKNPATNAFEYTVDEKEVTINDATYSKTLNFKFEHLGMLLDGAYSVSMSGWPYAYFQHRTQPITYFIVAQQNQQ